MVVVSVLIAAGVGSTFADFSDYEVSEDNYFAVGGMDLTVSNALGVEFNGVNIPTIWEVADGWPECSKDRSFDLHNQGSNEQEVPTVSMHWKNLEKSFLTPKVVYKYYRFMPLDGPYTYAQGCAVDAEGAIAVTEPDYVAVMGGVAGEDADGATVTVDGIGADAYCLLPQSIVVNAKIAGPYGVSPLNPKPAKASEVPAGDWVTFVWPAGVDDNADGVITLDELICKQIEIIDLAGCNSIWFNISLVMTDLDEADFGLNHFPADSKWQYWPTNALMYDKIMWDIGFEMIGVGTG